MAPYTGQLNNILNVSRSKSDTIIAIPRGVGGEGTTHMSIRIKKELQSFVDTSPPLKAVAILGGTIDVLKKRPAAETIKDIISMHETVLKFKPSTTTKEVEEEVANSDSNTNINTNKNRLFSFAITLPPIDTVHGPKDINELRLELNEKIRNFASNCQDRVVLIDLESIYDQSYAEEEHNWSPDLLHFSPKGYSGVANSVHYCLLSYLDIQMTSNSKMTDEEFFSSCFPESNNGDK